MIATSGRPAARGGRAVSKAINDDVADPNFKMSLSNEKTEVAGSGDLAYRRGAFTITFTNPQTKQAENAAGTYLTVFREAGGRKVEGGGRFRSLGRLFSTGSEFITERQFTASAGLPGRTQPLRCASDSLSG